MPGTRASSPAMSAQREQHLQFAQEIEHATHACAGEDARAPSVYGPISIFIDFLGTVAAGKSPRGDAKPGIAPHTSTDALFLVAPARLLFSIVRPLIDGFRRRNWS